MPTISPEGQIPIPKSVRDFLSIAPGDEVDFQIAGDRVFMFKKAQRKSPFRNYLGYLSNLHGNNSDAIIEELRGKIDDIGS